MKIYLFLISLLVSSAVAQPGSSWQRQAPEQRDLQLFHSRMGVVLPTAETPIQGNILFEVSHRFNTPISEGPEIGYGLDGGANIRLSLGYAFTDRLFFQLGRTDINDNIDGYVRYKTLQIRNDLLPTLVSLQLTTAYNSQIFEPVANESRKWQVAGQVIINTLYKEKLGIGLIPSFLYNANIFCKSIQNSMVLGTHLQYYINDQFSVLAEYSPTISGWRRWHDSLALALEIETGGHFFKITVTNNDRMNMSQYLAGADLEPKTKNWRLGFVITRTFTTRR